MYTQFPLTLTVALALLLFLLLTEWTREEKVSHSRSILHMLELDVVRDQQIGTVADGLAAEERKRVTIGVELAANPTLLFLDEPTSGLDAMGAMNVMRCVQKAAASGRTIICTIHQPSAKIFSFFTHLLLLKRGGEVCPRESERVERVGEGVRELVLRCARCTQSCESRSNATFRYLVCVHNKRCDMPRSAVYSTPVALLCALNPLRRLDGVLW
jgi:ABC-type multidrug transport system ATPase subunit